MAEICPARFERAQAQAAGVNLLAGRASRKVMHPLTPAELDGDFELETALDTGAIPLM